MPEDSGGEPLPPDPAARSPAARSPEAGSPGARSPEARSSEAASPGDLSRGIPSPDALSPDASSPEALFPRAVPVLPRLRVSACRRPAAVGAGTDGEWLDVLVLPGGVLALVLGRTEGPGRGPAAAVRLRAALRELLQGGAGPAEALAGLAAAAGSPAADRTTACVALLNPETGDVRYAASGQPRPVVCAAAGTGGRLARSASESPDPGPPGPGDARREAGTAVLPSGGLLLLYQGPVTVQDEDGTGRSRPAARDAPRAGDASPAGNGRPETPERMAATVSALMADPAPGGEGDLADRAGPEVLAMLTRDAGTGPATVLAVHRLQVPVGGWSMDLPADPLALRGLRTRLRDWLRELGASAADRTDVELAVWEAAVNAIMHGRPETGTASVTVRTALDETGRAVIQVSDRGRWQPPEPPQAGRKWPGGQGLLVIRQAADDLDITPGPEGTTVTLRRSLSRPLPGLAQPAEYPATAARHGKPA